MMILWSWRERTAAEPDAVVVVVRVVGATTRPAIFERAADVIVVPRATAQHAPASRRRASGIDHGCGGIVSIPIRAPFQHIPRQIFRSAPTRPRRETAYRPRTYADSIRIPIIGALRLVPAILSIISRRRHSPPGIIILSQPARGVFILRLGGQGDLRPCGIGGCIIPIDIYDGRLLQITCCPRPILIL